MTSLAIVYNLGYFYQNQRGPEAKQILRIAQALRALCSMSGAKIISFYAEPQTYWFSVRIGFLAKSLVGDALLLESAATACDILVLNENVEPDAFERCESLLEFLFRCGEEKKKKR